MVDSRVRGICRKGVFCPLLVPRWLTYSRLVIAWGGGGGGGGVIDGSYSIRKKDQRR